MTIAALSLYCSILFHWALYLLPGLACCCLRRKSSSLLLLMAPTALLGYISFWIFFWSKWAGKSFSFAVFAAAVAVVIRFRHQALATLRRHAMPLLLAAAASLLYLSLFAAFDDSLLRDAGAANHRFTQADLPGDNLIPYLFANRIYAHEPLRPFCCGDWLTSDRPPLEAGVVLLVRPLRPFGSLALQFQVVGTILQCLWVLGGWSVLTLMAYRRSTVIRVLLLVAFSSFAFFNSVYVWPKLLASAFLLLAVPAIAQQQWTGAATVVGLAMLAHPGSVFSLAGVMVAFGSIPRMRKLMPPAVILTGLLLPWLLYQQFVDPPGNRLTKMHLAGVFDVDSRSLGRALRDEYGKLSWKQIAEHKLSNVTYLVGPHPAQVGWLPGSNAEAIRLNALHTIWNALGLLNAGWPVLLIRRKGSRLLVAVGVNLAVWCLLIFGPSGTAVTHSSYADVLLLAIVLAAALVQLPRIWSLSVAVAVVADLILTWTVRPQGHLLLPYAVVGVFVFGSLLWWFWRLGKESQSQQ